MSFLRAVGQLGFSGSTGAREKFAGELVPWALDDWNSS